MTSPVSQKDLGLLGGSIPAAPAASDHPPPPSPAAPWNPDTLDGHSRGGGAGLYHLIQPILAAPTTHDILAAGCHALGLALDTTAVAVSVDDARTATTRFTTGCERADRAVSHQRTDGQGPHLAAAHTGEVIVIDDLLADLRWPKTAATLHRMGFGSVLALPVAFNGHRTGAASLYHPDVRHLDADQLRDTRLLAEAIAIALAYHQRHHPASTHFTPER